MLASLGEIWAKIVLEVCFDLKNAPNMRGNAVFFFGGHFLWSFFLAGLGKFGLKSSAPPKFACFHTYGSGITPSLPVIKKPL